MRKRGRKMTLREWVEKTGLETAETDTGAKVVTIDFRCPDRIDLWRLSDYAVSTVMADSIILVPRRKGDEDYG